MDKEKPIFIADESKNPYFVRTATINYNGTEYLMPNYLKKTVGHTIGGQHLETMDTLHSFPESDYYIRILMELYDNKTEDMITYAWVYIAHPDIVKSVRGE